MAKFNLESLPKCGAKTRSGGTCQRYGNKTNGRCKLHGGRSTGAKTKEGKLAVRVNALLNSFMWHFNTHVAIKIKKTDINNAISAYIKLLELSKEKEKEAYNETIAITKQFRVELETVKYYIAKCEGPESLLIIQSALDCYYKDTGSKHLYFHVYTPFYPTPHYNQTSCSGAQKEIQMKWSVRTIQKKGVFYSGRVQATPAQKELKKRLKVLKQKTRE